MAVILDELKRRMQGAIKVLKPELGGLRTGRASRACSTRPGRGLWQQHAAQSGRDRQRAGAAPVSVQVWDRSMVHAVEKAITAANLGLDADDRRADDPPAHSRTERGAPQGTRQGRA